MQPTLGRSLRQLLQYEVRVCVCKCVRACMCVIWGRGFILRLKGGAPCFGGLSMGTSLWLLKGTTLARGFRGPKSGPKAWGPEHQGGPTRERLPRRRIGSAGGVQGQPVASDP
jgi:hypothetical protein